MLAPSAVARPVAPAKIARVTRPTINSWLIDMDGVLVREEHAIAGAAEFVRRLRELDMPFLVLTNNSIYTRRDLSARLALNEIDVPEDSISFSASRADRSRRV